MGYFGLVLRYHLGWKLEENLATLLVALMLWFVVYFLQGFYFGGNLTLILIIEKI